MNKTISSVGFIAAAATTCRLEHKLVWCIRGGLVWAANAVLTAYEREDGPELVERANAKLGTMHILSADFRISIPFDVTVRDVEAHLGLSKEPDLHEEAKRLAKSRALRTRQVGKLKEFYDLALQSIEEQRNVRRARVSDLVALCDPCTDIARNADDYDEFLVEKEVEQLEGKIAEVCEGILDECEVQLAKHVIPHVITKWQGYRKGALSLLDTLGVTEKSVMDRRAKFNALLNTELDKMDAPIVDMDAELDALKPGAETKAPSPVKRATKVEVAAMNQIAHVERSFNDTRDAFESGMIGRSQAIAELKAIGRTGSEIKRWHNPRAKIVKAMADIGTLTQ